MAIDYIYVYKFNIYNIYNYIQYVLIVYVYN